LARTAAHGKDVHDKPLFIFYHFLALDSCRQTDTDLMHCGAAGHYGGLCWE